MKPAHAVSGLLPPEPLVGARVASLHSFRPSASSNMATRRGRLAALRPQALLTASRIQELVKQGQRQGEEDLAGAAQGLVAAAQPARGLWAAAGAVGAVASGVQGLFGGRVRRVGQLAKAHSKRMQVVAGAAAGIQGMIEGVQQLSSEQTPTTYSRTSAEEAAAAMAMPIRAELAEMREALKAATEASEAKAATRLVEVEVMDDPAPLAVLASSEIATGLSQQQQQAQQSQVQLEPVVLELPDAFATKSRKVAVVDAKQGVCATVEMEVISEHNQGTALVRLVGRSAAMGSQVSGTVMGSQASAAAFASLDSPAGLLVPTVPAEEGGLLPLPAGASPTLQLLLESGSMLWRSSVEQQPGQAPVFSCELVGRVPLGPQPSKEAVAGTGTNWTFGRALAGLAGVMLLYSVVSCRTILERHRFTKYLPLERSVLRRLESKSSKTSTQSPPQLPQPAKAPGAQMQQLSAIEAKLGAISQRLAGLQQRMAVIKAEQ